MVVSQVERNKSTVRRIFEHAFNAGDLGVIDAGLSPRTRDHQHPDEPSFTEHLKAVVLALRTAFPDLHFEIVQLIGEDDWVALYSVMTGTHTGALRPPLVPPGGPPKVPPTGRAIRVPHMHLIRFGEDGHGNEGDLYHLMDTFALVNQLGLARPARA